MKRQTCLLLVCAAAVAQASVTPRSGTGDPHVQSVDYDAEQVVELRVAPGYAVSIEFSPDERIENVALGNGGAWQATPNKRADHLFVKPVQGGIATNLTVITDARRYNFDLVPAYGPEAGLPYFVRFIYPQASILPETAVAIEATRYRFGGNRALRPAAMFDDGKFTSITWGVETTLPAIYSIDAKGQEMLVNGAVRNGVYVVEGVAQRFVFRLGGAKATATRLPARRNR